MQTTYDEYKAERQRKFNELPVYFAFSDKQFNEVLEKTGASGPEDFYGLGVGGGFFLKSDADKIHAFIDEKPELDELMKDYDFAKGAFPSEMANHEYHINMQADWDVINCFTDVDYYEAEEKGYLALTGWEPQTKQAYLDARKEFYQMCDEKDWW